MTEPESKEIVYTGVGEAFANLFDIGEKDVENILDFIILQRKMKSNNLIQYDEKRYEIFLNGSKHILQILHLRDQEFKIGDVEITLTANCQRPACIKFDGKDLFREMEYRVAKKQIDEVDENGLPKYSFWSRKWSEPLDERCHFEPSNDADWNFLHFEFASRNFIISAGDMKTVCRSMRCWGNEDYSETRLFCDDVDVENSIKFSKDQKFCNYWDFLACVPWVIYAIPCICVCVCLCAREKRKLKVIQVTI
jgi:hypothetical protein